LGRYDPLAYLLHVHRRRDGEDSNLLRRRYQEQVDHLLELVTPVEEVRALPPVIQPMMTDYSRIDPEIQEAFELSGIEQAISGQEWLRRCEERVMEEIGEGGGIRHRVRARRRGRWRKQLGLCHQAAGR